MIRVYRDGSIRISAPDLVLEIEHRSECRGEVWFYLEGRTFKLGARNLGLVSGWNIEDIL